jgi:hypothetical protein
METGGVYVRRMGTRIRWKKAANFRKKREEYKKMLQFLMLYDNMVAYLCVFHPQRRMVNK